MVGYGNAPYGTVPYGTAEKIKLCDRIMCELNCVEYILLFYMDLGYFFQVFKHDFPFLLLIYPLRPFRETTKFIHRIPDDSTYPTY